MTDPSTLAFAVCIVLIVISVQRSKKKLRTILYSVLCAPVAVMLFAFGLASLIRTMNTESVGRGAVDISFLASALVSLIHSRLTNLKSDSGKTPTIKPN